MSGPQLDESAKEFLCDVLERHANVNAFDVRWADRLKGEIFNPDFPEKAILFKRGLAEAILQNTIAPPEYERLTGEDFDTVGELNSWLRELWASVFGDAPIRAE